MIRVKLTTNSPDWPLIRQTPGRSGVWGDCRFFINEDVEECDFWVVYDDVLRPETTRCPPGNTLLITGEPPSVKTYHPRFLAQFAQVLTCQRGLKHPHVTYSQQALPWMIGCRYVAEQGQWDPVYSKDYDELFAQSAVPKTKLLSVLASDKAFTPGHERRLAFVEALRRHFGAEIDIFGRGIRPVEDKWDATAPYKYHVVLENGQFPDYWTEKLTDALYAGAYPLYAGCPNIGDYFPGTILTPLDLSDFPGALTQIEAAIRQDRFEASVEERQEAARRLLSEYNLFPMLEKIVLGSNAAAAKQAIHIQPQHRYSRTLLARLQGKANRLRLKISC